MKRFWDKVELAPMNSCWNWLGSKNQTGYGHFKLGPKPKRSHRVAWELIHGPIPKGMCVLHICDNPGCCNPKHLFLGSYQDNTNDMMEKGRHGRAKLTQSIVKQIRASKETVKKLAKHFDVSQRHIYYIKNYQTWKHL